MSKVNNVSETICILTQKAGRVNLCFVRAGRLACRPWFYEVVVLLLLVIPGMGCGGADPPSLESPPAASVTQVVPAPVRVQHFGYEVVNTFPHDPGAFTQGLLYHDGVLYESTGLNGRSSLRKVELATGRILQRIEVPADYFAEGLTLHQNQLYQLTWQNRLGFIYDLATFRVQRTFNYRGEGWGLTNDRRWLIMSDGTHRLRFLDPETFDLKREVAIMDGDRQISLLNELEFVRGELWANIWQSDRLVRINPETGRVTGWVNLAGLLPAADRLAGVDVLNGIAYDEAGDRLFVTGKLWPKLFEIRLVLRRTSQATPER